jgi:polar amino acid transport system substrate-binding protein
MNAPSRRFACSLAAALLFALPNQPAFAQSNATQKMVPAPHVAGLPGVAFKQSLADQLPEPFKSSKTLRVATSLTPPISFSDEAGKLIGINADIAAALGVILGVEIQMTDVGSGPAIVPSILSRRFDLTISGINDDVELQKQVDVIGYMYDATTIMVPRGNPLGIRNMQDLCGKRVGVPIGTFQNRLAAAASARCATPMDIVSLPRMPEVLQAIRSGRADATVNDYATSVYTTENQVGRGVGLQALPDIRMAVGYLGMLVPKDTPQLRDTLVAALQSIVDSGAYGTIMNRWGLGPLAVTTVKVNAANVPVDSIPVQ